MNNDCAQCFALAAKCRKATDELWQANITNHHLLEEIWKMRSRAEEAESRLKELRRIVSSTPKCDEAIGRLGEK